MTHPGDDSGFRPLLNWNPLRPCHRSASDWRGMSGHSPRHLVGELSMVWMEVEESHDCTQELLDVLGLGVLSPFGVGSLALGVAFGGPLGFQFGPDTVDGLRRCPDTA